MSDEFQTEQSAITLFRHLLPSKWIPREQLPDFHIDYLVEITDTGELTGIHLGVQLKGWQPKKNHKGPPKYSLKTKHLAYYVDKCTHPVFLVLADVAGRAAYWIFMQKFGKESDQRWRNQKKLTVEFDTKNSLSDQFAFVAAIREAVKYTRDLHPGSIKAALLHAEKGLEAKDQRVAVKINVVDGIQKITLHAKEDFPFTMKFRTSNPSTVQSIKNFIEKGDDLKIKNSEIEIVGAPILAVAGKGDEELLIQHRKELPGHVLLSWSETDVLAHVHVPGRFWAGTKYVSCEVALPNAPLQLSVSFAPEIWNQGEPFTMNLAIRPRAWEGQPLQTLAYFDSIHALVKALNTDAQVSLRLYVQGNILGTARMDKSALGDVSGFWDLLELLRKARLLAQHFQRNVVLPPLEEITNEDMGSVEHLFAVVFEGGHRMSVPNLTFSANIDRSVPAEAKLEDIGTFAIVTADQKYPFFGSTITIDRIETQLTHLKLTRCEPISDGKEARLSFAGTSQSERFVQIAKGELPS